jgi:hypothetical protein
MQTLFGVPDAEIEKHVFQPGWIHLVYEKFTSIQKELQRKIRGWPGICLFAKQGKNVTFLLCMNVSGCFMQRLGNSNTKTRSKSTTRCNSVTAHSDGTTGGLHKRL